VGKIPVVCAGSNVIIYDAIKAGSYTAPLLRSGVEGALAVSTLIDIINGKKPSAWVELP
jgi:ABC-type sugar transport system substrate-binding protein